jgi:processive 1,2-diacylglycerol beta-glucosyltransferase
MEKKKIVIFSIKGGFGHVSASNALFNNLKDDYIVSVRYLFEDSLLELDFISCITRGRLSFVTIYNTCIQYWWCFFVLQLFGYLGYGLFFFQRKKAFSLYLALLKQEKPDCIISVMGVFNDMLLKTAKQLDIPLLLIPTDIDARWYFIRNLSSYVFPKFYLCVMFYNEYVKKQLSDFGIPLAHVRYIGPIVRSDFFESKNIDAIKKEYTIPANKKVVMILMGGHGSTKLVSYTKVLSHFPLPIHLLLCVGKNEKSKQEISRISFNTQVSHTVIPFTEKISDIMSIADIIITKSGTLSVLEGMVMQKPFFLDATSSVLIWEQYNHQLIEKRFGYSIKTFSDAQEKLHNFLTHQEIQTKISREYDQLQKKNGVVEIRLILDEIFAKSKHVSK